MAWRSARERLRRRGVPVEHEVWVRFGRPEGEDAGRYMWVKAGGSLEGFYEGLVKVERDGGGYYLLKMVDMDKSTRYLVFVNAGVVRQVEEMERSARAVDGSHVGIRMKLVYHGLVKGKNAQGRLIQYHDVEVLYDDEVYDLRLRAGEGVVSDDEFSDDVVFDDSDDGHDFNLKF